MLTWLIELFLNYTFNGGMHPIWRLMGFGIYFTTPPSFRLWPYVSCYEDMSGHRSDSHINVTTFSLSWQGKIKVYSKVTSKRLISFIPVCPSLSVSSVFCNFFAWRIGNSEKSPLLVQSNRGQKITRSAYECEFPLRSFSTTKSWEFLLSEKQNSPSSFYLRLLFS